MRLELIHSPNNLTSYSNDQTGQASSWWLYLGPSGSATLTQDTFTGSGNDFRYGTGLNVAKGKIVASAVFSSGTKTGSVVLRDLQGPNKVVVSLSSTPTRSYYTETLSSANNYQFGLDNRVAYGGDGIAGNLNISGFLVEQTVYETTPRADDITYCGYTGPNPCYWGGFDYTYGVGAPNLGYRNEAAATNLYLNSFVPATQTVAVANGSTYTVSFYGTGTLTLSGAATQVMVGVAGALNQYTFVAGSTSLVLTDAALTATAYPQVELGSFASSRIPTGASAATRAADAPTLAAFAASAAKVRLGHSRNAK